MAVSEVPASGASAASPGLPATGRPATGRPDRAGRAADLVVLLAVLAGCGYLLWLQRDLYWIGDDWTLIVHRMTGPYGVEQVLMPHNAHPTVVTSLLYKVLFELVGLQAFLPYAVPVTLAHGAVCLLTYALVVRTGARRWCAAPVVVALAVLGAGAEDLLWAFQVGFVGSLAFGLGAAFMLSGRGRSPWPLAGVWGLLLLAEACSGVGAPMLVLVCAMAFFRPPRQEASPRGCGRSGWAARLGQAALVGAVPAAALLAYRLTWGSRGAVDSWAPSSLWSLVEYAGYGFASAWASALGLPTVIGGILGLALVLAVGLTVVATRWRRLLPHRLVELAIAGVLAGLVLLLFAGTVRAGLGAEEAGASRYAYIVLVLGAPLVVAALQLVAESRPRAALVAGLLVALLGTVHGVWQLDEHSRALHAVDDPFRARLSTALGLVRSGQPVPPGAVDPSANPDVTGQALTDPELQRAFPADPSHP